MTAARDGVHVAVSVADDGRGVPPDRLPHLRPCRVLGRDGDREVYFGKALALFRDQNGSSVHFWVASGSTGSELIANEPSSRE